jgi:hypothetical protein
MVSESQCDIFLIVFHDMMTWHLVIEQEASVVYSMKNINSTNNTFRVQLGLPTAGSQHVYTLTIEEGLYDAVDEIMAAIAVKCIETGTVPRHHHHSTEALNARIWYDGHGLRLSPKALKLAAVICSRRRALIAETCRWYVPLRSDLGRGSASDRTSI